VQRAACGQSACWDSGEQCPDVCLKAEPPVCAASRGKGVSPTGGKIPGDGRGQAWQPDLPARTGLGRALPSHCSICVACCETRATDARVNTFFPGMGVNLSLAFLRNDGTWFAESKEREGICVVWVRTYRRWTLFFPAATKTRYYCLPPALRWPTVWLFCAAAVLFVITWQSAALCCTTVFLPEILNGREAYMSLRLSTGNGGTYFAAGRMNDDAAAWRFVLASAGRREREGMKAAKRMKNMWAG